MFNIEPQSELRALHEQYSSLPIFNLDQSSDGWTKGLRLASVRSCETTEPNALVPNSVEVRASDADAQSRVYKRGVDFQVDDVWGTIGRIPSGSIGPHEAVSITYQYQTQRIDSILLIGGKTLKLRKGVPDVSRPLPPSLGAGDIRVANLWVRRGENGGLKPSDIFILSEDEFPESLELADSAARGLFPKTFSKLRDGGHLKILAWGDSVTAGACLKRPEDRWQEVFVKELRLKYPKAHIQLLTEAWPARNTAQYLSAASGDPHNFQEKVLDVHPDLILSEFINDRKLSAAETETRYSLLLENFRSIGAEWIILTPAYTYPRWMDGPHWSGITDEHDIDRDPRPYVQGLRSFAAENHVALADASLRWGRLWRQGIPYTTLLANSLNHPDARGHLIYAKSLMALFKGTAPTH
jgi:lysophospholipase L1-like esterase